jgi:hypothetical protein
MAVILGTASAAAWASVMQFGTDGLVSNFDAAPGGTVVVPVYLYETFDPVSETAVLEEEGGLFSAGLKISRVSAGPSQPAGALSPAHIAPNAAFNETEPTVSPLKAVDLTGGVFNSASLVESRDLWESTGVVAEAPTGATRRVFLGAFTFTAGNVLGEVTDLRIQDNDPLLDDTVTWALPGLALDADIQAFDFTITAVPEPATMGLLAAGLLSLVPRRRGAKVRVSQAK